MFDDDKRYHSSRNSIHFNFRLNNNGQVCMWVCVLPGEPPRIQRSAFTLLVCPNQMAFRKKRDSASFIVSTWILNFDWAHGHTVHQTFTQQQNPIKIVRLHSTYSMLCWVSKQVHTLSQYRNFFFLYLFISFCNIFFCYFMPHWNAIDSMWWFAFARCRLNRISNNFLAHIVDIIHYRVDFSLASLLLFDKTHNLLNEYTFHCTHLHSNQNAIK